MRTLACPHSTLVVHGQRAGLILRLVGLWLLACMGAASAAGARVASVNLCADQLLLALVEPARIRALGPLARDPDLSFLADRAGEAARAGSSAETLLRDPPEALLASRYDRPYLTQALERRGVRILRLEDWTTLEQTAAGLREAGRALDSFARGEALASDLEAAIARLRDLRPLAQGLTFLIVHKRGFVETQGVMRDALEQAGLRMAQTPGQSAQGGFVSTEAIIAAKPDLLVAATITGEPSDLADAAMAHPALTRAFPPARRLAIPRRLTICPGPSTPAMLEHLDASLRASLAAGGLKPRRGLYSDEKSLMERP